MNDKKTPLFDTHVQLGAKMVAFAGYQMPVYYGGINDEHLAVRQSVGMFDVSHMGEFIIEGENADKELDNLLSNDVISLKIGHARYTALCNEKGGIIDDLIVYKLGAERFLTIVNASNREKDWIWMHKNMSKEVKMTDVSDEWGLIAVQGPKSVSVLKSLFGVDISAMKRFEIAELIWKGSDIKIATTGYTGEDGVEIMCPANVTVSLWEELAKENVVPCGLGSRDTLRLEVGYALHGNDIDENRTPVEANLGWIVRWKSDFIGKDNLLHQKRSGVDEVLMGFKLMERGIPRHDYDIVNVLGEKIGTITSGSQSPILNEGIAMGYISTKYLAVNTIAYIQVRKKRIKAKIVNPPFIQQ